MFVFCPGVLRNGEMAFDRLSDRLAKGYGLARLPVHVNTGDLADCGNLAGFCVTHLMPEADGFFADLDHSASDDSDIPAHQFALLAHVLLNPTHAAAVSP